MFWAFQNVIASLQSSASLLTGFQQYDYYFEYVGPSNLVYALYLACKIYFNS